MARAQEMPELAIGYPEPIYIHIGGSALVYELDEPVGMIGWPVHGLEGIPGIRRLYLENYVRYTFVRYGVPYVVAIECSDAGLRIRKMSCRDADKVAVRVLKALHVAGGTPQKQAGARSTPPPSIGRRRSPTVFTYHSPGDIIPGTGFRRKGGVADYTVYSKIRFPIADGAGLRQFPVVHELGQLRGDRTLRRWQARRGQRLSLPGERPDPDLGRIGRRELLLSVAR